MFSVEIYRGRRAELARRMASSGVVVIPANEPSAMNYLTNDYPFYQDSTFRYLFGDGEAGMCGVIDLDSGAEILFGSEPTLDDAIWSGKLPALSDHASMAGVERSRGIGELSSYLVGRKIHLLPPYQAEVEVKLCKLYANKRLHYSPELIFTLGAMRERKGAEEIAAIDEAYEIGARMHLRAMDLCREGVVEATIGGALEGMARAEGLNSSFTPIATQHGERLHNVERWGVLESGRMFLCDAGVQARSGYCSDHTRTYPISGRFTAEQRDIYNIVLAAHNRVAEIAKAGMLYTELQTETLSVIGAGLRDIGILRGSDEVIAESKATTLFMPHGVGHGLGLDVHDCQAFGERGFDLSQYPEQAAQCTSCLIRDQWVLEQGTVLTNEPGIYFIPELIEKRRSEGVYRDVVNFDMVERFINFGGVRIEDDMIITEGGCRKSGAMSDIHIPITINELEGRLR
ncbi:MAG: aminopeptidase P family protein [Rikenellaceae bacterium]